MKLSDKNLKKKFFLDCSEESSDYFCSLKNLFKKGFIANCHLDDASVTEEELETLEELDQSEVLENLKDLMESLIEFKRNVTENKNEELAVRCEKLEKMLQVQEAEVRKHISTEHQLKLMIEALQEKNTELQHKYDNAKMVVKGLENGNNESVHEKLSKMEINFEQQLSQLGEKYSSELKVLSKESEKLQKLEQLFEHKEKSYLKLQEEFSQMRKILEKTTMECQSLRKEMGKYSVKSVSRPSTKKSLEGQDQSMTRVHTINRSILFDSSKKVSAGKKKSYEILFASKPSDSSPTDTKQVSVKTTLYHTKRHGRSHSDYVQPPAWKKIILKN